MNHPLTETSSIAITSTTLVVEDYNRHPALCRSGIWVGIKREFYETYLLSYEHDPEDLYVGWAVNGITLVDPGYSPGTPPSGAPMPGATGVTYTCPVAGLYHRISLAGTPGMAPQNLWVQVLYRYPTEYGQPFHYGPGAWVDLIGYSITWPAAKVAAWRQCLRDLWNRIRQYLEEAHVAPGDPVEAWMETLRGDDVIRLNALVETLGDLNGDDDRELRDAILDELRGIVRWAQSPGAPRAPASRETTER